MQTLFLNAMALRPNGSGVQTYCRELIRGLDARLGDAHIVVRVQEDAVGELPGSVRAEVRPRCSGVRRLVEGLRPTSGDTVGHGLDVDVPMRSGGGTVTTVHDLSVFDVPWAHARHRAAGERFAVARAIRTADVVIAVSSFTAAAIGDRFGREAVVTELAPGPEFAVPSDADRQRVMAAHRLPDRFVLHVGTIEPRKDISGLMTACDRLDVPLVLAGAGGGDLRAVGDVRPLGYVSQADLAPLYGAASLVAYPSFYEGFGLPPIEAISCGAPVVATTVGALPGLVGGAIPLVTPGDVDALTEALRAVLSDDGHASEIVRRGMAAIGHLSWDRTAAATVDVYRRVGWSS